MMKRKVLIVVLIVAVSYGYFRFLFGFKQPYEFRQEYDQIVKIEILQKEQDILGYDPTIMKVLKTLDITEHRTFIDGLMKVEGSRVGLDPSTGFGTHIIRITYRNGEIELIGHYNNGYVSVDRTVYTDCYAMDKDQFYDLLSRVLGEQVTEPTYK